jgi:hypothetical protein
MTMNEQRLYLRAQGAMARYGLFFTKLTILKTGKRHAKDLN